MRNWYYHLPDLLLALLSYLLIARLLLFAALTPRLVPQPLLLLAALAWLYAARVILRVGIAATGVRLG